MNYGQNIKLLALWRMSQGFDPSGSLQVEHELPDWLGEVLEGLEDGDLLKGAGHKYIRRVPKAGGKGWRYFYTVTGGHGLGHHSEFVKGASFKVKDAGQEGHFHIIDDYGDDVAVRHDESGKSARISKAALAAMLQQQHAQALGAVKERARTTLAQAHKTGTPKQQQRAQALAEKYGVQMSRTTGIETGGDGAKAMISARPEDPMPEGRSPEEEQEIKRNAIRLDVPEDSMAHLIRPGARGLRDDAMRNGPVTQAVHDAVRTFLKAAGVPNPEDFKINTHRAVEGPSGTDTLYRVHVNSKDTAEPYLKRGTRALFRVIVRVGEDGKAADRVEEMSDSPKYDGHSFDLAGNRVAPVRPVQATIKAPAGLSRKEFERHGGAKAGKAHWWLQRDDTREFVNMEKFAHPGDKDFQHSLSLDPGLYTLGVGDHPKYGAGKRHSVEVGADGSVLVNGDLVKSVGVGDVVRRLCVGG